MPQILRIVQRCVFCNEIIEREMLAQRS